MSNKFMAQLNCRKYDTKHTFRDIWAFCFHKKVGYQAFPQNSEDNWFLLQT